MNWIKESPTIPLHAIIIIIFFKWSTDNDGNSVKTVQAYTQWCSYRPGDRKIFRCAIAKKMVIYDFSNVLNVIFFGR